MKIYKKIVIDIQTGQVIEQVAYNYNGPVAMCDGGGGGGPGGGAGEPPGPGNIGGVGTGPGPGGGPGGGPGTYFDREQGGQGQGLTIYRDGAPDASSSIDDFDLSQFDFDVDDIFLTDEEKAMLDEIEGNRVKMLTDAINEKVYDIQQTEIARLIDRGVLQSDVGAESLAKTRDYASQGIEEGTLAIGTQRMQDEMSFLNSKRDFALKGNVLEWDMNRFVQGLKWQTEQSTLDRSLAREINKNLEDAADDANKWGLFGNVVGGAFDLAGGLF